MKENKETIIVKDAQYNNGNILDYSIFLSLSILDIYVIMHFPFFTFVIFYFEIFRYLFSFCTFTCSF